MEIEKQEQLRKQMERKQKVIKYSKIRGFYNTKKTQINTNDKTLAEREKIKK